VILRLDRWCHGKQVDLIVPTPSEILATLRAISEAVSAYFTWLLTEEGKAFSKKAMEDRTAWDQFWKDAGNQIGKLFRGEMFK
jgi:hypothetical protein